MAAAALPPIRCSHSASPAAAAFPPIRCSSSASPAAAALPPIRCRPRLRVGRQRRRGTENWRRWSHVYGNALPSWKERRAPPAARLEIREALGRTMARVVSKRRRRRWTTLSTGPFASTWSAIRISPFRFRRSRRTITSLVTAARFTSRSAVSTSSSVSAAVSSRCRCSWTSARSWSQATQLAPSRARRRGKGRRSEVALKPTFFGMELD
mmetsp:Transcript_15411/g.42327  ORF Transcript_15411/g.42327 Transcript_15411/m.42327 type:complete len:210 (-) Transcript_15411:147-776(-)